MNRVATATSAIAVILSALFFCGPLYAVEQPLELSPGMNFVALTVSPEAPTTSRDLLEGNGFVRSVFRYDEESGTFRFQTRQPSGALFGDDIPIESGRGFAIDCSAPGRIALTGTGAPPDDWRKDAPGYQFVGLSPYAGRKASAFLDGNREIQSIHAWDTSAVRFTFRLRTAPDRTFGDDFTISAGTGYILGLTSAAGDVAVPGLSAETVQAALHTAGAGWSAAENEITRQMTDEAFLRRFCGLTIIRAGEPRRAPAQPVRSGGLPASFSWASKDGANWITEVKDQGQFPTCVAFAACAGFEAQRRIADSSSGESVDFSEAYLFQRGKEFYGRTPVWSNGWYIHEALGYLAAQGDVAEPDCPYSFAPSVPTLSAGVPRQKISNFHSTQNPTETKSAILNGPVIGALDIYEDFYYYHAGVYQHVSGAPVGGHAVLMIGWDDAGGYWLCKNSWGTGWGEGGYFRIKYGESIDNNEGYGISMTLEDPAAPVSAPCFSPASGSYYGSINVGIICVSEGSAIRYTLDGSTPTATSGTLYSRFVSVPTSRTLKAIAYAPGRPDSEVVTASYTIWVPKPAISPAGGNFDVAKSVTISSVAGTSAIRYTTDGSTPTGSSATYTGPVTVSSTRTLKAIAVKSGCVDSPVAEAPFKIAPFIAKPVASPAANLYAAPQAVALATTTAGASIRYTTDGSIPTPTTGLLYAQPVAIASNTTLNAIAFKDGMNDSPVYAGSYRIRAEKPVLSVAGGRYLAEQSVTITSATEGASIRYTTNGAIPTDLVGTVYSGPVIIPYAANLTLTAVACKPGMFCSVTSQAIYYMQVASPVMDVPAGSDSADRSVTLTCATPGATIRYTLDGTYPSATAGVTYSGPIPINATKTLRAIAIKTGMTPSSIITKLYTQVVASPVLGVPAGIYNNAMSVTIACATAGATIRYTLDGTYPSATAGTVYTGAVPIDATKKLIAIATKSGWASSSLVGASYTLAAANPVMDIPAGVYHDAQNVTITSATAGASIHYTLDGTLPSATTGAIYASPIPIPTTKTLRAIACKAGMSNSATVGAVYTLIAGQPAVGVPAGTYHAPQSVSLTSETGGATIHYTLDGTYPSATNGTDYTAPIPINATKTLRAIALKSGLTNSPVTSATYTILP